MTSRRPRHVVARTLAYGALGTGLAVAACETPHPTGPRPNARVPLASIANAAPEMASKSGSPSIDVVRQAIARHIPAVASGGAHASRVWFVADASGNIVNAAFDAQDGPGLSRLRAPSLTYRADSQKVLIAKDATVDGPSGEPSWIQSLDPGTIASVDILKVGPGRVAPDSMNVIWIALKPAGAVRTTAPRGDLGGEVHGSSQGSESRVRIAMKSDTQGAGVRIEPVTRPASAGTVVGAATRVAEGVSTPRATAPAPTFYVDGKKVGLLPDGKPDLGDVTPDRIESVEVLKGEKAIQTYGPDAANGVVLITTKKQD